MKENIYNGLPSIELDNAPFFSIIIACYNSGKTIGNLLDSIVAQDMNDDIEVIISDDHSTEPYQEIIDEYSSILSIKQIQTDYNFAPGNTRERGVSVAEGEWLVFADHDDDFIPGTLKEIRQIIIDSKTEYYAIANFNEVDPETKALLNVMKRTHNWNHAKFYNRVNLWLANNIHFQKDLLTHEDICISSQINCAMHNIGEPTYIDISCYNWNNRPTTISRSKYGNHSFLEVFYEDYIKSTANVYIDKYLNGSIDMPFAIDSCIESLTFAYCYMQGFKFEDPKNYIKSNEDVARRLLVKLKNVFGLTNKAIYDYLAFNQATRYYIIRETAYNGCGRYIESESFMQWLDNLHSDINRITMSDAMRKENL